MSKTTENQDLERKSNLVGKTKQENNNAETCGIVMPIAPMGEYTSEHWSEVREIIKSVLLPLGIPCEIVSYADESGIIQNRIVQNLYSNTLVICDVSGKNPNVMFELGMRLAFDKPTIVIKDDLTDYSFDTAIIEHLSYPHDLRYSKINQFKVELERMIKGTLRASKEGSYTTFLKHFGTFKVANLAEKTLSKEDFILEEMSEIRTLLQRMNIQSKVYSARIINKDGRVDEDVITTKMPIQVFIASSIQKQLDINPKIALSVFKEDSDARSWLFNETKTRYRNYGTTEIMAVIDKVLLEMS